jgi:hypothetical protein
MARGKSNHTMFNKIMGNLEKKQAIGDIILYFFPIILIVTLKEHKNPTGGKYMIFFPPVSLFFPP